MNGEMPHLGAQQPGETYYFSALIVNLFGIINMGGKRTHLMTYTYHEGEGSKGGNFV